MSNDEMDKEIAEFCGWRLEPLDGREFNGIPVMVWKRPDGERGFPIPCYSFDLNAMHEAEALLTDEQHRLFRSHLGEVVGDVAYFCRKIISSEAAQRAQAFLRTIGKWRDE